MTTQTNTFQHQLFKAFPLDSKYMLTKKLGSGGGGAVFRGLAKKRDSENPLTCEEQELRRGTLMELAVPEPLREGEIEYCRKVAVKKLELKEGDASLSSTEKWSKDREAQFALNVKAHDNLIQFLEMFVDAKDEKQTLVMELMDTDLANFIKDKRILGHPVPSSFDKVKYTAREILRGLSHIHSSGFIHRDIKPENILISKNPEFRANKSDPEVTAPYFVKISDFGLSTRLGATDGRSGTMGFMAPELRTTCKTKKNRYFHYDTGAVDIWAFGCLLYEMVTGTELSKKGRDHLDKSTHSDLVLPYIRRLGAPSESSPYGDSQTVRDYVDRTLGARCLTFLEKYQDTDDLKKHIEDSQLRDVIRACLQWDPANRPTAEELSKMPYFSV